VVTEGGSLLAEPGQEPTNLWERFREFQSGDPGVRVQHEVIVADRPSATHILEILDKLGCDLIVMGTHGRRGLRRVLFESLTEDVVRRARCPVIVVKVSPPAVPVAEPAETAGAEVR
jgi:nucleotide-binding universal stress UspA family protein